MRKELWDNWHIIEKIGEGPNGEVYKASKMLNNQTFFCAIKYLSLPKKDEDVDTLLKKGIIKNKNEINNYYLKILQVLKNNILSLKNIPGNNYVLKYYDFYQEPKASGIGYDVYIRMELASESVGDINRKKITAKEVAQIGIDVCNGFDHLKRCGIVYKNIKPTNIFIGGDGHYKLGDFGIPHNLNYYDDMNNYVSPEAYNNKNLVSSSDTYSLGLIMYQLLNKNRLPFVNLFVKNKAAVEARMEGLEIPNLKRRNQELMQIIIKACSKDAANRYKETYLMRDALQKLLDSGSLNNENDLSGNNQQNLGKTISIYDNQNIVPLNLPINKNSATQTKQQELKGIKGFIHRKIVEPFEEKKNSIFGGDFINEKIVDPFNNFKEKITDKQFYIDNRKTIILVIVAIIIVVFLKGCVFSNKKCKSGYINKLGVCVKGWYTCEKGYTLNSDNKCSKTLKSIEANVKYKCDEGYTLQDKTCLKSDTKDAKQAYQCAGLGTLKGDKCVQEQSTKAATNYTCPQGYILYENKCSTVSNQTASSSYYCPSGYNLSGNRCSKTERTSPSSGAGNYSCNSDETLSGDKCYVNCISSNYGYGYGYDWWGSGTKSCYCPVGYQQSGSQCYRNASYTSGNSYCPKGSLVNGSCEYTTTIPASVKYSCPSGYQVYGNQCIKTSSIKPSQQYYCAGGMELRGDQCVATITADAINGFECDKGYALAGTTCVLNDKKDAKEEYSCSKIYTLNGDRCEKYKIQSPKKHYGTKK